MPVLNSKDSGDLFVRVVVGIPKLSADKEKIFGRLLDDQ